MSETYKDRTTGQFGLNGCPLHRKTPFGMTNVSMTQLSIARHYGGIKYNGESYTYLPKTDELIRNDVLKWQTKNAKKSLPNAELSNAASGALCVDPCPLAESCAATWGYRQGAGERSGPGNAEVSQP